MKKFGILLLAAAFSVGIAVAQDSTTSTSTQPGAKQDMKDAGHATKDAGKDVGHATKKAGKGVAHGTATAGKSVGHATKKVVHGGASKTEEGSEKVKDKTAPQQ